MLIHHAASTTPTLSPFAETSENFSSYRGALFQTKIARSPIGTDDDVFSETGDDGTERGDHENDALCDNTITFGRQADQVKSPRTSRSSNRSSGRHSISTDPTAATQVNLPGVRGCCG